MTRLWRWLCCLTGHHRETVCGYLYLPEPCVEFMCVDCYTSRTLYRGVRFTPSRRYALKRQGRAA